jgi:hypothetical protein
VRPSCSYRLQAYALITALFAACGTVSASPPTAPTSEDQLSHVPQPWLDYAALSSVALQRWLAADSEVAGRLRTYFSAMYQRDGAAVLPVSLWIDESGTITRVQHAALLHPDANQDLEALIVGRKLPQPPPTEMRLPMRLQLRLRPLPPTQTS